MERPDPEGGERLVIAPIGLDRLDELVAVHQAAFPDSQLGSLGREAVARNYRWQFTGPHDLTALGATMDGRLVGFVLGGRFRGSTSGFVRANRWFLAGRVLRHPKLVLSAAGRRVSSVAIQLLVRRAGSAPERPQRVPDGSFGILVIAVDPSTHRTGVGSALLAAAEHAARAGGYERLHLTLHPGNVAALAFYADHGWIRAGIPGDDDHQWLLVKEIEPAG